MSQQDMVCCGGVPVIAPAMSLHEYMGSAWLSYPAHASQSRQAPLNSKKQGSIAWREMQLCKGEGSKQGKFCDKDG